MILTIAKILFVCMALFLLVAIGTVIGIIIRELIGLWREKHEIDRR